MINSATYSGSEPIYIQDDWQVVLGGAVPQPSNSEAPTGTTYSCSSANGVIALIPSPYSFTVGTYVSGGLFIAKNITFYASGLISSGVPSSLTKMTPPSAGLYYPLNFGVEFLSDNGSSTSYATVDYLELHNVSVSSSTSYQNAAINIRTNAYETLYLITGNFNVSDCSSYNNSIFYVDCNHFVAEVLDLGTVFSGNNNTDKATLEIHPGLRTYIGIIHFGSTSVCPLYVGKATSAAGFQIGQIYFELGSPPVNSTYGVYYGSGLPGNINMEIDAPTIIGMWGGGWHPLLPGTAIAIGSGAYLKIGKVLATNGGGDNIQYPWGNGPFPTGITGYSQFLLPGFNTNGSNQLATASVFLDKPVIHLQNLTAQSITATTATAITLDSDSGVSSFIYNPKTSFRIKISAKLTVSNNTIGDSITVGLYNGTTLLASETYAQEGLASNPHDIDLSYTFSKSDISSLSPSSTITFTLQSNVSAGTGSVIVKDFTIEEL